MLWTYSQINVKIKKSMTLNLINTSFIASKIKNCNNVATLMLILFFNTILT
jgi:hypothetical protein